MRSEGVAGFRLAARRLARELLPVGPASGSAGTLCITTSLLRTRGAAVAPSGADAATSDFDAASTWGSVATSIFGVGFATRADLAAGGGLLDAAALTAGTIG